MKPSLARSLAAALFLGASVFSITAHATGGAWQEDMRRWFQMDQVDADKDHVVSKKEFLVRMGEAWDAGAAAMKVDGDRMTPEQFHELMRAFNSGHGN
jgi:hypothetical protein